MDNSISTEEFHRFRTLIYDESGISLSDQKRTLLASRLSKRVRDLGLETFSEYFTKVTEDPTREEFMRMLDLISTNKTDFFREPKHFEFLRERILPELEQSKRIRIWSSACSTGEEPYTIAMTLCRACVQDVGAVGIARSWRRIFRRRVLSQGEHRGSTTRIGFAMCRPTSCIGIFYADEGETAKDVLQGETALGLR